MIPPDRLRALRNNVSVLAVIQHLGIPTKARGARPAFRCPVCGGFHTATNPLTNLARCFACQRNFNTLELVMAERACTFLEAVDLVGRLLGADQQPKAHRGAVVGPRLLVSRASTVQLGANQARPRTIDRERRSRSRP
jgi:transposase-like protein